MAVVHGPAPRDITGSCNGEAAALLADEDIGGLKALGGTSVVTIVVDATLSCE